jgi:hypothetical protein
MWSEEQLNDAVQVLWNASETGDVEKVTAKDDKDKKETYLVVNSVTYTDPLYMKALDKLIGDGKFVKQSEQEDRLIYRRDAEKACKK